MAAKSMASSATALISAFVLGLGAKARSAAKPLKRIRRKLDQPDRLLGRWRNRVMPFRSMLRRLRLPNIRYVGVTGSCGKTTTTKLIGAVLSSDGPCYVGAGFDGIGTTMPDLTGLPADSKFCAYELYGTRPGRLKPALRILRPEIGVVTTVGRDHYKNFRTLEATAQEKGKLIEFLAPQGTAILNIDDPNVRAMSARTPARVLTYGCAPDADIRATDVHNAWPYRLSLTVNYKQQRLRLNTKLVGEFWITSILAAIACGVACGLDLEACVKAVAEFEPVFARSSVHSLRDGPDYILDTQKAPVWTIPHCLSFLSNARAPRKTMVIGTLSDYPGGGSNTYRKVARQALQVADRVIFVGPHAGYVSKLRTGGVENRLFDFMTTFQAATFLNEAPIARELIYFKASVKDHLERIMLDQFDHVVCWKERCGKAYACPDCRNYRHPHPPPFGLDGAEAESGTGEELASSEAAPSL
jgi:UDP-N-acetylmuramoyl-tripeptide--D-alanyl-D-alanine ligase